MSTISDPNTIKNMLKNDGIYPGDPRPDSIYQYENNFNGGKAYAVFYPGTHCDIYQSPYCHNPVCLFTSDIGVTTEGKQFLTQ